MEFYKKELEKMFSNTDFDRFLEAPRILRYSQLADYDSIQALLPLEKDYVIILYETKRNSGHWMCLIRNEKILTFFDSYGYFPDEELSFITRLQNKLLGQDKPYIRRLMKTGVDAGMKAMYSHTKYQSDSPQVATCGRWVILAVFMLHTMGHDLKGMKRIFDKASKEMGKPYDVLAVDFTNK